MNKFDKLKEEILERYPHVNGLGFLQRIKAKLKPDEEQFDLSFEDNTGIYKTSAILVEINGKKYTKKFGKLQ